MVNAEKIELPSKEVSTAVSGKPLVRIAGYAWNAQSGIIVANGGPKTTKGSIMEKNGVNLEIVRQDWLSELRNMQMKFVEDFDKGSMVPSSDKSAFAVMIMGDGAPFYISSMQKALNEKFSKGKYHSTTRCQQYYRRKRVFNYADAMKYFGMSDGVNRYKAVNNQVGSYLKELNPFGFNENVGEVVPYDSAVNLYYLKNINDIESTSADVADYSKQATEVMASGEWKINFNSGSSSIQNNSTADLEKIYNLLVQAENSKLTIVGHTDNVGNADKNLSLSKGRAQAVADYLTKKGIPSSRFQIIDGKGSNEPVGDNTTEAAK